jgi:hypothetical protein
MPQTTAQSRRGAARSPASPNKAKKPGRGLGRKALAVWLCLLGFSVVAHEAGWTRSAERGLLLWGVERQAASLDAQTPKTLGEGARLDSVKAGSDSEGVFLGESITLTGALSGQIDVPQTAASLREQSLKSYCSSALSRLWIGPVFQDLDFYSADGASVAAFRLTPKDCEGRSAGDSGSQPGEPLSPQGS